MPVVTSPVTFTLFTDGSCLKNPGGPGGWAAVLLLNDTFIASLYDGEESTTNNRMEVVAAVQGLSLVPDGTRCVVYSDSTYLVNTMGRGWRRGKNNDLWTQLDTVVARKHLVVTWEWVKGHNGNRWNVEVDRLARAAAIEYRNGMRAAR